MAKFEDWSGPARKRLYRALPLIGTAMVVFGMLTETKAGIIVAVVGALIGPVQGEVAARHVPDEET